MKKIKSSKITVIFKGDAFEEKVSPSDTKCHLWPKKYEFSVILTISKGDTFFFQLHCGLFYNQTNLRTLKKRHLPPQMSGYTSGVALRQIMTRFLWMLNRTYANSMKPFTLKQKSKTCHFLCSDIHKSIELYIYLWDGLAQKITRFSGVAQRTYAI